MIKRLIKSIKVDRVNVIENEAKKTTIYKRNKSEQAAPKVKVRQNILGVTALIVCSLAAFVGLFILFSETFPGYVTRQLGLSSESFSAVMEGKEGFDKHPLRDLTLLASISSEDREALLARKHPFILCDYSACSQTEWKLVGNTSYYANIGRNLLVSEQARCATMYIKESSRRTREDVVCIATDSNKIWYSSYAPDY